METYTGIMRLNWAEISVSEDSFKKETKIKGTHS
jgi:hypothetical protein